MQYDRDANLHIIRRHGLVKVRVFLYYREIEPEEIEPSQEQEKDISNNLVELPAR